MNTKEKIALFSGQIMCGAEIYTWQYDAEMNLKESNCPKESYIDDTLLAFGGKDALRAYAADPQDRPLVLNISTGLMWCAAADQMPPEERTVYLIGPVWSSEASVSATRFLTIDSVVRDRGVTLEWIREMDEATRSLPVVMPRMMYQYALMLYYTVNDEKKSLTEIIHRQTQGMSEPETPPQKDRDRTFLMEQAMLDMVRNGDLGYQKVYDRASSAGSAVQAGNAGNVRQAKNAALMLTSLCCRAAIEGGLSPDKAYNMEAEYVREIENGRTIPETSSLSYSMYSDYVKAVRAIRLGKSVSSHIRAVCDYVEQHDQEPLSTRELASRVGYSEQYLRRKFAEEMGTPLPEYIRGVRIRRAKQMLMDADLSIQEIADALQFCSRAHFSETFRKEVGITPAKYREQNIKR